MPTFRHSAGAAALAAGLATALAAPAHAAPPPPFTLGYHAAATTTVKKLGQEVDFPATTFEPTVTLREGAPSTVEGPLALPAADTSLRLGSLKLVTITLQTDQASPVYGVVTIDGPVWTISSQQTFSVHITKIAPFGVKHVNLVGRNCRTAPTTASLVGTLDFSKVGRPGGPDNTVMSGSYAVPRFTGCGLVTPMLNTLVSGPANPISVHLTMGAQSAAVAATRLTR
jgi:hypothetical protein